MESCCSEVKKILENEYDAYEIILDVENTFVRNKVVFAKESIVYSDGKLLVDGKPYILNSLAKVINVKRIYRSNLEVVVSRIQMLEIMDGLTPVIVCDGNEPSVGDTVTIKCEDLSEGSSIKYGIADVAKINGTNTFIPTLKKLE